MKSPLDKNSSILNPAATASCVASSPAARAAADTAPASGKGKVYLVGAGMGTSDYLTLKAARLLGKCDGVRDNGVLFTHLFRPPLLSHIAEPDVLCRSQSLCTTT